MDDSNEPKSLDELRHTFLALDQRELDDYADFAQKDVLENRVALLEKRLLVMGVVLNKALSLLVQEREDKNK